GVVSAPLSKYLHCQTRICRPVGLSGVDCEKVCRYASERIGLGYDFKNVIDLMRHLFPWPVAQRCRRRTIALGSGDASLIIACSRDRKARSRKWPAPEFPAGLMTIENSRLLKTRNSTIRGRRC